MPSSRVPTPAMHYTTTKSKACGGKPCRSWQLLSTVLPLFRFDKAIALVKGIELAADWPTGLPTIPRRFAGGRCHELGKLKRIKTETGPQGSLKSSAYAFLVVAQGTVNHHKVVKLRYDGGSKTKRPSC
jgi:hypothetical protein